MAEARLSWDPELFARAETLEWRSRVLAEGFLQGFHRSRMRGFSSEFAQYSPYVHGDDLRYVDWRAYGRLDRLYIRQFEAETNMRCHILLDASASMAYRSEGSAFRKFDYAALMSAALMRLLQTQRDACGLSIGKDHLVQHFPPRLSRSDFWHCLSALETTHPEGACHLGPCMHSLAELSPKRGLIAIFTDAWDDLKIIMGGLARFRHQRHEVCLFQVVDARELDFDFKNSAIFQDMESGIRLPVTPDWNRAKYFAELNKHQSSLVKGCLDLGVTHHVLATHQSPFEALSSFLAQRQRHP